MTQQMRYEPAPVEQDDAVTIDLTTAEVAVEIVDQGAPSDPFMERSRLVRASRPRLVDRVRSRRDSDQKRTDSPPATKTAAGSNGNGTSRVLPDRAKLLAQPRRRPRAELPTLLPQSGDGAHDPGTRVYSSAPSLPRQRGLYLTRRASTALALGVLALLLWWAFGALGDGVGELFDLFRSNPDPATTR